MARRHDLPDSLPLFVLPGALMLPRTRLPLQVFEPRYLQMLDDTLKTDHRMIGIIQPAGDDLAPIGCAGRVVAFSENDDGRYMVSLKAVSRFQLTDATQGFTPYLKGGADWSDYARDRSSKPEDVDFDRDAFLGRLVRFMEARDLATDLDNARQADAETLINALSMLLPLAPEEKQALLEAQTLEDRLAMLDGLIEYALRQTGADHEERLQ